MMLLLLIVFALVDLGSPFTTEVRCYGTSYSVHHTPVYYTPKGGRRTLVVSKEGESKHKRFSVSSGSTQMQDLTEQDDGGLLVFGQHYSVILEIQDCQVPLKFHYGDHFLRPIPSGAQYLEFSRVTSPGVALKPHVLWNRTAGSRDNNLYYEMENVKQKDSGYYRFMGAADEMVSWKRLNVEGFDVHATHMEGTALDVYFPVKFTLSHIEVYTREGGSDYKRIEKYDLDHRMELTEDYFLLTDLKQEDSGTYRFIDDDACPALRVELEVRVPELSGWVVLVAIAVIILCILICGCCVKKCCCKKTSNKRDSPATAAAASPAVYRDTSGPAPPAIPLLSTEPRVFKADPPTYTAAVVNTDPPPSTQVTVPAGPGPSATPGISSSSDSMPKYEFKGMVFPSALELGSDTSIQHVYTSEKLNFL